MADMYGAVRSNEFRVKDVEAFKTWFEGYIFGDEIEVWVDTLNEDGSGTVSFGEAGQYPSAYPRIRVWNTDDGLPENEEDDDWEAVEADLDQFAMELRQHLVASEIFQVVAGGAEKLRYVGFTELLIAEDVDTVRWNIIYSDDSKEVLRDRLMHGIMS